MLEAERKRNIRFACVVAVAFVVALCAVMFFYKLMSQETPEASFMAYKPQQVEQTEQVVTEDISSKLQMESPPVQIVVSAADTALSVPNVSLDIDSSGEFSSMGGDLGGDGLGPGVGGGGKGMGTRKSSGSQFCGRFWDLKKTESGAPSPMSEVTANQAVLALLSRFYNGKWSDQIFSKFFESKLKLYTSCFFMPQAKDQEAANAYDPGRKMGLKPSRWVAVYRAQVQAPKTGTFRFVGAADSVMGVRFNGQNVLECGFHLLSTPTWNGATEDADTKGKTYVKYKSCEPWNEMFGGFVAGEPFRVQGGNWYNMEVLVSEIGGGDFGFCLLIDDMEESQKPKKDGAPLYHLFRTAFVNPTAAEIYETVKYKSDNGETDPPYDEDSSVWVAKPIKQSSDMKW